MTGARACKRCHEAKPIEAFYRQSLGEWREHICKQCKATMARQRRLAATVLSAVCTCQACGAEMQMTSTARRYCNTCRVKSRDKGPLRHYCSCGQPLERPGTCEACSTTHHEYRVNARDIEDVPLGAW